MVKQNLITVLRVAINEAFSNDVPFVVWYDNGGTLQAHSENATPKNVELIKSNGSYLVIRSQIEEKKDFKKQRLIYIQEKALEPSWLKDYEIFGRRIDLDLIQTLDQYFRVPINQELKNFLNTQNCKKLAEKWDEVLGNVDVPLSDTKIKQALLALVFEQPQQFDVKLAIFTYLKNPECQKKKLEIAGLMHLLIETLRETYGYKIAENEATLDPKRLASTILLTELVQSSNSLGEKEFDDILPPKPHRKFWASLAAEWAANEEFKDSFVDWSHKIENDFKIETKIRGQPDIENAIAFKAIEDALLEELINRIGKEGLKGIQKNFAYIKAIAYNRNQQIWSRLGISPEWKMITISIKILEQIYDSYSELEKSPDPRSLIENYTKEKGWWQIDQLYRDLSTTESPQKPELKTIFIDTIKEQYHQWLKKTNNCFTLGIEKQNEWRVEGIEEQRDFWRNNVHPHKEKVAVFFLDAFRYELQKRLIESLKKAEIEVRHQPVLSSLPSVTEICMPALLPNATIIVKLLQAELDVKIDGKQILIKKDRTKFLEEKYAKNIVCLELKDFEKPTDELRKQFEQVKILVMMSQEIDKAGKFLTDDLLDYFDKLLLKIKKIIEKTTQIGFNKIIIATDHGFLYYPMPSKIETTDSISSNSETIINRRYAIGKPSPASGTVILNHQALPYLDENITASFPIGISTFPRPGPKEAFIHGGISLQECCIGILECTPKKRAAVDKVGIKVTSPSIISSAIFLISLQPIMKQITDQPRSVTIELIDKGKIVNKTQPITISDKEQQVALKLTQIPKLIEVKVKDSETEEILFSKEVKVSLEGYDETI